MPVMCGCDVMLRGHHLASDVFRLLPYLLPSRRPFCMPGPSVYHPFSRPTALHSFLSMCVSLSLYLSVCVSLCLYLCLHDSSSLSHPFSVLY